jgi:hypothetical protein
VRGHSPSNQSSCGGRAPEIDEHGLPLHACSKAEEGKVHARPYDATVAVVPEYDAAGQRRQRRRRGMCFSRSEIAGSDHRSGGRRDVGQAEAAADFFFFFASDLNAEGRKEGWFPLHDVCAL